MANKNSVVDSGLIKGYKHNFTNIVGLYRTYILIIHVGFLSFSSFAQIWVTLIILKNEIQYQELNKLKLYEGISCKNLLTLAEWGNYFQI